MGGQSQFLQERSGVVWGVPFSVVDPVWRWRRDPRGGYRHGEYGLHSLMLVESTGEACLVGEYGGTEDGFMLHKRDVICLNLY